MATKVVMGINFFLGASLTVISLRILEKTRKCTDVTFQRTAEGILIMSVALLVASICYIICHLTCECKEGESALTRTMFALYFIAVGATMIVLGSILYSKSEKNCKGAKNDALTALGLGILVVIMSAGFFIFENREHLAAMGKSSFRFL